VYRRLTDPAGHQYLLQAARSGFVEWSSTTPQGAIGWVDVIPGGGSVR
jgi:hypothetical protein